ncbi:hypothetical protein WCLP8_3940004 [uncultured Gammaproteobacteria bacterium]
MFLGSGGDVRFTSAGQLIDAAKEKAENLSEHLKHSIFTYYICRYLVAVYEARHGEIPIQVWNEHRNTLDHFYRYVTTVAPDQLFREASDHLKKMEAHTLRAALDMCKISCHRNHDYVKKMIDDAGEGLKLLDGGGFHLKINGDLRCASKAFEDAKISDVALGGDSIINSELVNGYVEAVFNYEIIAISIEGRWHDIEHIQLGCGGYIFVSG